MKCESKSCLYSALIGEKFCAQHLEKPRGAAISPKEASDVEIVPMNAVPQFRVLNKKAFDLAKTAITLQADHALKIKVLSDKERIPIATAILNYAKKLGTKLAYRSAPGFIYVWKKAAKIAALKKAAS